MSWGRRLLCLRSSLPVVDVFRILPSPKSEFCAMMLGLADDVPPDSFEFTRADRLEHDILSAQRTSILMISLRREKVAKAAAELLVLRSLSNVADGLCRSHSQRARACDRQPLSQRRVDTAWSVQHFENLAFDDWRELFSENMPSVLGWPHQMEVEPVAGGSMYSFVEVAPSYGMGEVRLRPLTRSVSIQYGMNHWLTPVVGLFQASLKLIAVRHNTQLLS